MATQKKNLKFDQFFYQYTPCFLVMYCAGTKDYVILKVIGNIRCLETQNYIV
jgi:hypothetical protein